LSLAFPLLSAGVGGLAGWAACWIVDRATVVHKRMQAVIASISSALLLAGLSLKYRTPGTVWFVYGALVLVLVGVTVFDIRKHQIPHLITIPGMIAGLLVGSFVLPLGPRQSILGFVVGGGVLLGATIVEAIRKKEIGGGDWKYAAMIGSFIGPQRIIVALILTGVFGVLGAIALGLTGNHARPQALGPWLSAGAVASILLG
jgi:leader peptidase (prepilin peptidase) / N-methyltransferase